VLIRGYKLDIMTNLAATVTLYNPAAFTYIIDSFYYVNLNGLIHWRIVLTVRTAVAEPCFQMDGILTRMKGRYFDLSTEFIHIFYMNLYFSNR
jgi:hypothetical protein